MNYKTSLFLWVRSRVRIARLLRGRTEARLDGDDLAFCSRALGAALAANSYKKLAKLWLSQSGIGDIETIDIAAGLCLNVTLRRLDLSENCIGDAGAEALAEALQKNGFLRHLQLRANGVGDAGAVSIARVLQYNNSLTELNLDGNKIGDVGAESLAAMLRLNSTLTAMWLGNNCICDCGALAFVDVLQENAMLTVLALASNNIKEKYTKCKIEGLLLLNARIKCAEKQRFPTSVQLFLSTMLFANSTCISFTTRLSGCLNGDCLKLIADFAGVGYRESVKSWVEHEKTKSLTLEVCGARA